MSDVSFNSFTTQKPVEDMTFWERLKNTLNPFGSAAQRQNFNESVTSFAQAWPNAWDETFGNPYYIPPAGGPGSGIIPSTKSAQEAYKREVNPPSGAPLLSAGAVPFSQQYLLSRNPIAQSLTRARANAPEPQQEETQTFQDFLDMYGGSFNSQPYDDYMNYLAQQDTDTYNRIQAMYNKLAEDAGANVERIKDIYGGAEQGVGETYAGAKGATEQAYASAQQQAADQLARLGIAEAAPQVIDPMALSQAEAVSNLAAGEATGQSGVTQRGATARDFASQMAQVGQQQGLEATAAILRDMGQRQAEAAFQRAQAEANYNPYEQAMQRLQAEQAFYAPSLEREQAQLEAIQRAAELQLDNTLSRQDKLLQLWSDIRGDYGSDDEAWAEATKAMQQAEAQYPVL